MDKDLSRLCGVILSFEALYIIFYIFPLIVRSFNSEGMALVVVGVVVIAVLLLLLSGIGLLLEKRWSVVILWISLALSFAVSVFVGHSYPSFYSGNFQPWFIDLIIAIFLSIELKKSKMSQ
jgi:hypothetical protein